MRCVPVKQRQVLRDVQGDLKTKEFALCLGISALTLGQSRRGISFFVGFRVGRVVGYVWMYVCMKACTTGCLWMRLCVCARVFVSLCLCMYVYIDG